MQHHRGTFPGADGTVRYEQAWQPEGEPKATVALVHGLAEHSGRYRHVAEALTARGYAVHAFDLLGHGQSHGTRAYVPSFDVFLGDVDRLLARARGHAPGQPLFLLGHSLGGTITALYAIERQPDLAGIILSGPALRVGENASPLVRLLAPVLSRFFPRMPTVQLKSSLISRDSEVVARYDADLLVYHSGIPARTGAEMMLASERIQEAMEGVRLPLLLLQGGDDQFVDPEGSEALYRHASSEDKTLKRYEGLYHEVFHEPEQETVLEDLLTWLDARV